MYYSCVSQKQTQQEYASTTYSNFTFGKQQFFRGIATYKASILVVALCIELKINPSVFVLTDNNKDKMLQHVFKNPSQIAGNEEAAFADQEEQDNLGKPF